QLRGDGTIFNPNSGLCLNVNNYATSPSSPTEIWGCNGNPAEQWQLRGDGTIFNPNSGLCLNVNNYATSPSSPTELWYCQGQPSEQWVTFDLPQLPAA
ncbi:RICIN domain-containing protein, partial [Kitasatospora aureofaciens]